MKKARGYNILVFFLLYFSLFITGSDLESQLSNKNIEKSQPWEWESIGPNGGDVKKVIFNHKNSHEVYMMVSSLGNIFYSKNQGYSWEKISGFNRYCSDMVVDPHDPKTFFVISSSCVFKSIDRGKNWKTHDLGTDCKLNHIGVDPLDPQIIHITGSYGSEGYQAVYRSTDSGESWSYKIINSSVNGGETYAINISPSDPNNILISGYYNSYSGLQHRLYKSTNAGNTWVEIANPINSRVLSIAFDPQDPLRIYTTSIWGIFTSSDGGSSWDKLMNLDSIFSIAVDPINPNIIYAGADNAVYKSLNKGESWLHYTNGLRGVCHTLAIHFSTVYFGSEYGLYKSQDEGQSWIPSHKGIENLNITLISVAPSSPNVIYARAEDALLYKTQDSGKKWIDLGTFKGSVSCDTIFDIAVNPQNSKEIFALTGG